MTSKKDPPQNIAVLMGNGFSIAFNENLVIPKITQEITKRLDQAGEAGGDAAQMMQEVAQRLRIQHADTNFEALVAPFDEIGDVTRMMERLAGLAGDRALKVVQALRDSAKFAHDLRRHAVSHILDVIATESAASLDLRDGVEKFITGIVDASRGGEVTFGNLNYDSILMAVLVDLYRDSLCDLTDPRKGVVFTEVVPGWAMSGGHLRLIGDLPRNRRITLLHLHGSLTWLHNTKTGAYVRFGIDVMRRARFWKAWREGKTDWEPVVVLTNQDTKTSLVKEYPFALAYETFYSRLLTADKWLIAGASLQDECVNEMLQRAFRARSTVPQVMVVTKGAWPTERQVLDAVGYDPVWGNDPDPEKWLTILRDGIDEAVASFDWMWWDVVATPLARTRAG